MKKNIKYWNYLIRTDEYALKACVGVVDGNVTIS